MIGGWGVQILGILQRGCESLNLAGFRTKVRGVISVIGEKLHAFEIIYPKRRIHSHSSLTLWMH